MAKLCDLLVGTPNFDRGSSARIVRIAMVLSVTIDKAGELYGRYGNGYIYAGNIAVPDTPLNRGRMTKRFGACAVVSADGVVFERTLAHVGRLNRIKAKRTEKKERDLFIRYVLERNEAKRVQRLFSQCQGRPCPKRQGRANSLDDIGKYVFHPRATINETSRLVSSKIRIPNSLRR